MTTQIQQTLNDTTQSGLNHTPFDVKPRRMNFPYQAVERRKFFDDNLLKSAYIAAMSATFPAGEGEFIESIRLFRDDITDPLLKEQVKGFIGQEGHHSYQHKQFNQTLSKMGLDAAGIESIFEKDLKRTIRGRSAAERLAFTVAFEHQTAILSEEILTNPDFLKNMDPTIKDLLEWHAVEEIEHKGVAFDVYMACVGNRKLLNKAQRMALWLYQVRMLKYMSIMVWRTRTRPCWSDLRGFARFIFGKKGMIRNLRKPYMTFFEPEFHPWDHDNQELIEEWKQNRYQAEFDRACVNYRAAK